MTKANTTDAHEERGSPLLSNKEEEKPLETTSQKEELPEVVPNTPQEGTHLPATGEETSQLALLGLGILAGLVHQSDPLQKETRLDPKHKEASYEFCSKEVFYIYTTHSESRSLL